MLVACIQLKIQSCQKENNLCHAMLMTEKAVDQGAEIIVLPELFLTGFCYDQSVSDNPPYPSLDLLRSFVQEHNCMMIGSLISGRLNLGFCLEPEKIGFQAKIHPFGQEKEYFDGGSHISPIDTSWGKVGLEICYDLRFPEMARKLTLDGADYLVTIAQFPASRSDHCRNLSVARAIENQIPHMVCNCAGPEFCGSSMIVDSWGQILAEAGTEETIILGQIDLDHRDEIRNQISCLDDRRPEIY
ncbi:MAG: nitrilase-related carbon-nitrogen hydrolase [Methanotrichaceae archaeon]